MESIADEVIDITRGKPIPPSFREEVEKYEKFWDEMTALGLTRKQEYDLPMGQQPIPGTNYTI
jgi:hypothetical protein